MKTVGPLIEKLLRSYNLWHGYKQHLVVEEWNEVVGSELSAVTKAKSINNGVLRVAVKDSVWAYHLTMLKPRLINKLNKKTGDRLVKDIFFTIEALEKKGNSD
ncbi:MAG: DUF721 domain-containing protein [Bacillota bacterium]